VNDNRRRDIAALLLALFSLGHRAWEGALVVAAWYAATARVPHWLKRRERPQDVVIPISTAIAASAAVTATVTGIAHATATAHVMAG
jgi:hypothetical protein